MLLCCIHSTPSLSTLQSYLYIRLFLFISSDAKTTTSFMIGTTIGDAVLPVVIGFAMQIWGSTALLYLMLAFSTVMATLYGSIHVLSRGKLLSEKGRKGLNEALINVTA